MIGKSVQIRTGRRSNETCARVNIWRHGGAVFCVRRATVVVAGWPQLALRREDVESALEVVGGGGEMHLGGGFGEASPSHSTQTVAPFPGAKDLLDPGAHAMNRCIPGVQAGQRIPLVAAPHRRQDDAWRAALGPNRIPEMRPAIGAV